MKTDAAVRDGVRLGYEDDGSGDPPIVLIHGWSSTSAFMRPLQELLAAQHRVVNVDLRGHGRSDAPDQDYGVGLFAEDVAWLVRTLEVESPVLVGHSLGAAVALDVAKAHRDCARALVLLDPPPLLPRAQLAERFAPIVDASCSRPMRRGPRSSTPCSCPTMIRRRATRSRRRRRRSPRTSR